jgi:hypothetical protein
VAPGAPSMDQAWLKAAFCEPAHDLVLGEADVRFDPHVGNQSASHVCINRLAVNLQQLFEVFGRQHIGQELIVCVLNRPAHLD